MRSRPNARLMANEDGGAIDMSADQLRRRPVKRTQMGEPRLRSVDDKPKPAMTCRRAMVSLAGLCLVSGFLTFACQRRSRHLLRRVANYKKLKRCDITTYPLWQIGELKELNLSRCGHVALPADAELWSRFASVKKLDLNDNALQDLPAEISALSSLEILFMSENQFDSVPQVIGELPNLRVLSLRGNKFRTFFSTHLPADSLVWLILTNNKIKEVHSNISELKLLRKLMLSHNEIEHVPVELGQCKDLELLRLANNKMTTMPHEVLSLPKLAWISISGNPMSIPPKIGERVIKPNEIKLQKQVLGSGASGTVFRGKYRGKKVAVKIFKEHSKGSDGTAADEAAINGMIDHPLAISAIGVMPLEGEEGAYQGMVMDLDTETYPLGKAPDFDTVARDAGPASHSKNMTKEQVHSVVWNMASVLDYLHSSLGVSHGDVYLHNTLRDGHFVVRLSDWGASFVYDRDDTAAAAAYERLEVLAFGRLVQNLFAWHLDTAVPDVTERGAAFGGGGGGRMDAGPFRELLASVLQPDQARRPTFRRIKEDLTSMAEFKQFLMQE